MDHRGYSALISMWISSLCSPYVEISLLSTLTSSLFGHGTHRINAASYEWRSGINITRTCRIFSLSFPKLLFLLPLPSIIPITERLVNPMNIPIRWNDVVPALTAYCYFIALFTSIDQINLSRSGGGVWLRVRGIVDCSYCLPFKIIFWTSFFR